MISNSLTLVLNPFLRKSSVNSPEKIACFNKYKCKNDPAHDIWAFVLTVVSIEAQSDDEVFKGMNNSCFLQNFDNHCYQTLHKNVEHVANEVFGYNLFTATLITCLNLDISIRCTATDVILMIDQIFMVQVDMMEKLEKKMEHLVLTVDMMKIQNMFKMETPPE